MLGLNLANASPNASNQSNASGAPLGFLTHYWDCCKPSCAWNGKGDVDRPVLACEAETGEILTDANVAGVCDGGTAASCASNQPWTYNDGVSLGFAAASVGGNHGLNGDENCGQCYELVWSDEGGAHPDIVGKSHIIQVTNIGYDVTGDHSFDLQIPGGGQGIFCLLYTSPSPRDGLLSRMPSSA